MIQNGFVYIVDNYIIGRLLEVHDYIVFLYKHLYWSYHKQYFWSCNWNHFKSRKVTWYKHIIKGQNHKYFLKKASVKLNALITSLSTFGSLKSPWTDHPWFMSGNSKISKKSPKTCLPSPPGFVLGPSCDAGKNAWGHLTSLSNSSSSWFTIWHTIPWLGCKETPAFTWGYVENLNVT